MNARLITSSILFSRSKALHLQYVYRLEKYIWSNGRSRRGPGGIQIDGPFIQTKKGLLYSDETYALSASASARATRMLKPERWMAPMACTPR